ncbi:MAG: electron transfer flavoprotein subunit alpha/FixB family protein [Syntrophobacterales bacterium]|jgi:electron transfer flavoprotein alpha subunit|nr:electron transfer flavoprotein subunit alpha/FixB family protein [Syntrophobacterales bacterium]
MAEYKNVGVFCETNGGKLAPISTESLGIGRKLADDLGQSLVALLIGDQVGDAAKDAIRYGADKVYVVDNPMFKDYLSDSYVEVAQKLVDQASAQIVIMGQTDMGRDLAPRLAFRLGTVSTSDCLELAIDGASKRLLQTKPVYGGNAKEVFIIDTDPQIVTIRSKAMTALAPEDARQGEVVAFDAAIDVATLKMKLLEKVVEEVTGVKLEEATIVVSGGRGIGSPEGFSQLEELAALFKGAVGASRPAVDQGWLPPNRLVGITGKIIGPDLYIAVAISGSTQHMTGCGGSKTIVGINLDPEAGIFKRAHFGVIGDWKAVVPALTEKIKTMIG